MERIISECEPLIRREMDFWNVPGLTVSVVEKGGESCTKSFGFRDVENRLAVTDETLFGIASCSKAMTSAIIAMLVGDGLLDYDVPVREYIPDFALMDEEASEKTSLRDMLCHRTGLGGHDAIWPAPKTFREFTRAFPRLQPSAPFRSKAQYSNIIFTLPGYIAETVTGKPWASLMSDRLFEPLGMARANCKAKELIASGNYAHPYQVLDGTLTELAVWDVDEIAPAASVNCTGPDMCRWLAFLAGKGRSADGRSLIPEEIFETMITKQIDFEDYVKPDPGLFPADGYAMGWQTGEYRGKRMCRHTGKIEGYSTVQAFLPEDGIGVSIMMNLHSPAVVVQYPILYTIVDRLLDLPEIDWAHRFRDDRKREAEDYRDCHVDIFHSVFPDAIPDERPSSLLMKSYEARSYEGDYYNAGYGPLSISARGDKLYMSYRDMCLPMEPYWPGNFLVAGVKEDILTMSVPLSFVLDETRRSIGVRVRFEPLVDDILFLRI